MSNDPGQPALWDSACSLPAAALTLTDVAATASTAAQARIFRFGFCAERSGLLRRGVSRA